MPFITEKLEGLRNNNLELQKAKSSMESQKVADSSGAFRENKDSSATPQNDLRSQHDVPFGHVERSETSTWNIDSNKNSSTIPQNGIENLNSTNFRYSETSAKNIDSSHSLRENQDSSATPQNDTFTVMLSNSETSRNLDSSNTSETSTSSKESLRNESKEFSTMPQNDAINYSRNLNNQTSESTQEKESNQDKDSKNSKYKTTFISRFDFSIPSVMKNLKEKIIGQEVALEKIEEILSIIKAELSPKDKPLAVLLLLGGTGVGKSSTAILLAQSLKANLCRIDMNTLAQEHYAASLVGAPPGYVGSKEGNTLFDANAIAGSYTRPSVVLFDEIEKASKEVLLSLLDVLDSGELTLTSGVKKIDFRNSIIIMTSNLGAKEISAYHKKIDSAKYKKMKNSKKIKNNKIEDIKTNEHEKPQNKKEKKILIKALEKAFLPEFINRIDNILHYTSISKEQIERI